MRINHLLILLSLTGSLFRGCFQQQVSDSDLSPKVSELLSDMEAPEWGILNAYRTAPKGGEIFVMGSSAECAAISSRLLLSDDFDNVDGSLKSDRLPDFAGERIASVVDSTLSLPVDRRDSAAVMAFRDRVARLFVAALDTMYCADRFGYELNAAKPKVKMLVIPSSQICELSVGDIDTLMNTASSEVKVIFASEVLQRSLVSRFGEGAVCLELDSIPSQTTPLRAVLQAYAASAEVKPVSALVIRNYSISALDIMKECEQIRRGETWDDFELSKLIDDRFRAVDPVELTVRECFRSLRKSNLFTHDIAYPISHTYIVESNGSLPVLKKNVQN